MKRILIPAFVFVLYRCLMWTWKVELIEPPTLQEHLRKRDPVILSHWHGDELALLQLFSIYPIGTIVSTSEDGQMMDRLVRWMGGRTSRGSSTRGGVGALKGLLRIVREGWNTSFAVDGPKGPVYKVKPGVFEVSKLARLPIFWCGVATDRAFRFPKTWNQTYLPKPFARVRIEWHGPLPAVDRETDPRSDELALQLEQSLNAARRQVSETIADPGSRC